MKYPKKITLFRGVSKEEAKLFKKFGDVIESKSYGGVSHWTTDRKRAESYGEVVIKKDFEVDIVKSKVTSSKPWYPELKGMHISKIGGKDYGIYIKRKGK